MLQPSGVTGVAVNGVLFMNHALAHVFDDCLGHVDPDHIYHYHGPPTCLLNARNSTARSAWWFDGGWPVTASPSTLIGWALDGWPIFGPYDEHGVLMIGSGGRAGGVTLDECNGKFLADGSYGYFTTPSYPYSVACFRGVTGRAVRRESSQPLTRCPKAGLTSLYCDPVGVGCPALRVPLCDVCESVQFLFPTCPAREWPLAYTTALGFIHVVLASIYVLHAIDLLAKSWTHRKKGDATLTIWVKSAMMRAKMFEPFYERLWGIGKVMRWSRYTIVLATMRAAAPLRTVVLVSALRAFFLLADPFYSRKRFPPFLIGISYGIVYPSLNSIFKDHTINLLRSANAIPVLGKKYVLAASVTGPVNFVAQVVADFFRSLGSAQRNGAWLVACQVTFIAIGISYVCAFQGLIPCALRHSNAFDARLRRVLRMKLALLWAFSLFLAGLLAHSLSGLGIVTTGGSVQDRYLFAEVLILCCLVLAGSAVLIFDHFAAEFEAHKCFCELPPCEPSAHDFRNETAEDGVRCAEVVPGAHEQWPAKVGPFAGPLPPPSLSPPSSPPWSPLPREDFPMPLVLIPREAQRMNVGIEAPRSASSRGPRVICSQPTEPANKSTPKPSEPA